MNRRKKATQTFLKKRKKANAKLQPQKKSQYIAKADRPTGEQDPTILSSS